MHLPGREHAYVPQRKLIEYLLSETHAIGKSKAKFFAALGYDQSNADILGRNLLKIAAVGTVTKAVPSAYGTKYVVDGMLETPTVGKVTIRTVWIIENESTDPRFVTAYPV